VARENCGGAQNTKGLETLLQHKRAWMKDQGGPSRKEKGVGIEKRETAGLTKKNISTCGPRAGGVLTGEKGGGGGLGPPKKGRSLDPHPF